MLKILDRVELKYENLVLDEVLTKGENVFPPIELSGEKDGFGWLTGRVQKNGDPRILIYG